jgi:hypothetical protein
MAFLGGGHPELSTCEKAIIVYYILAGGCSAVGDLENGNHSVLEGNGVDFASVVQYECDPGYETYGNIIKYCKTGGNDNLQLYKKIK